MKKNLLCTFSAIAVIGLNCLVAVPSLSYAGVAVQHGNSNRTMPSTSVKSSSTVKAKAGAAHVDRSIQKISEVKGYCCTDGEVQRDKKTREECGRKGSWYATKSEAERNCGFCCNKNGKITSVENQKDKNSCTRNGDFYSTKAEAKENCGWCLRHDRIFLVTEKTKGCTGKGGSFHMTKALADRKRKLSKGFCKVGFKTLKNKVSPQECEKRKGKYYERLEMAKADLKLHKIAPKVWPDSKLECKVLGTPVELPDDLRLLNKSQQTIAQGTAIKYEIGTAGETGTFTLSQDLLPNKSLFVSGVLEGGRPAGISCSAKIITFKSRSSVKRVPEHAVSAEKELVKSNLPKLAPFSSLECQVSGTPVEFPDDLRLLNKSQQTIAQGTAIKYEIGTAGETGTFTLSQDLLPNKSLFVSGVLEGGRPAGISCSAKIITFKSRSSVKRVPEHAVSAEKELVKSNLPKLAPFSSLECQVSGTPVEFPDDLRLLNKSQQTIAQGTAIKYEIGTAGETGTFTLSQDLLPNKSLFVSGVLEGGRPAGISCSAKIITFKSRSSVKRVPEHAVSAEKELVKSNLPKLAPFSSLECQVSGTPVEFPDDLRLLNKSQQKIAQGTAIKYEIGTAGETGTFTLSQDLLPNKSLFVSGVLEGGRPAGIPCSARIIKSVSKLSAKNAGKLAVPKAPLITGVQCSEGSGLEEPVEAVTCQAGMYIHVLGSNLGGNIHIILFLKDMDGVLKNTLIYGAYIHTETDIWSHLPSALPDIPNQIMGVEVQVDGQNSNRYSVPFKGVPQKINPKG